MSLFSELFLCLFESSDNGDGDETAKLAVAVVYYPFTFDVKIYSASNASAPLQLCNFPLLPVPLQHRLMSSLERGKKLSGRKTAAARHSVAEVYMIHDKSWAELCAMGDRERMFNDATDTKLSFTADDKYCVSHGVEVENNLASNSNTKHDIIK